MGLIFTIYLIAPVLHAAVPHVVTDQLARDAVRRVFTLELIRIGTRLNILEQIIFTSFYWIQPFNLIKTYNIEL